MAYDIVIGGELEYGLATLRGWSNTRRWVETLKPGAFGELIAFVNNGLTEDIPRLKAEAREALKASPPDEEGVRKIIEMMADSLDTAKRHHVSAYVSDGFAPDDGEDGEWESRDDDEDS